jgi:hypothetical protein
MNVRKRDKGEVNQKDSSLRVTSQYTVGVKKQKKLEFYTTLTRKRVLLLSLLVYLTIVLHAEVRVGGG